MKALPPSIAKILANHVIANERALECDWDVRGTASVQLVQTTVSRAFAISLVGSPVERNSMIESLLEVWRDKLVVFESSAACDEKCVATRLIRAVYVSLLCLGLDERAESLFTQTVASVDLFVHQPPERIPASYLYNISKRLDSLNEMHQIIAGEVLHEGHCLSTYRHASGRIAAYCA